MEFWQIVIFYFIAHFLIQLGITIRRNIIENHKTKRLEIIANLDRSKIEGIGYYENKDSSLLSE